MIRIKTTLGDITVRLYDETPLHKANFEKLVGDGFYNGTIFHRVIAGFMNQGGDPNTILGNEANGRPGTGGPGYTIPAEIHPQFKHKKGALASARLGDQMNPRRESSGSQFYIVNADGGAHFLDGQYTVFGEVVDGMDVVDAIAAAKTGPGDMPVSRIEMTMEVVTEA
jgi:cyclophilin family peptidyl-prolyl cis-trans isomerase